MDSKENPYQPPASHLVDPDFTTWTIPRLVGLFFAPALLLTITLFIYSVLPIKSVFISGISLILAISLLISFFNARIHTTRQLAGRGTLALFTFVFFLAQILSLFLIVTIFVIVTGLI